METKQVKQFKKSIGFADQTDIGFKKGLIRNSHADINHYLKTIKEYLTKKTTDKKQFYTAKRKTTLSNEQVENHLTNQSYIYYTNKPDTDRVMVCLDFDYSGASYGVLEHNHKTSLTALVNFLSYYFPDSYYDYGSSGKSLNYFLYIDVSSLRDNQLASTFENFNLSFPGFLNKKLSLLSDKLRDIFNSENSPIDTKIFKFDSIKATMSDYSYKRIKGKVYYEKILKSGVFAKLPCPATDQEFNKWYNKKLYTYEEVEYIITTLHNEFTFYLSSFLNPDSLSLTTTKTTTTETETIDKAHSVFQMENSVAKNNSTDSILLYTIDMTAVFAVESIKQENSAIKRSMRALRYLIAFYQNIGQELSLEIYIQKYRELFGTGPEDKGDRERLTGIYNKFYSTFKEQLSTNIKTKIQYLIGQLKEQITEKEIRSIQTEFSKYKYGIYYEDLAGAALSYFTLLVDQRYRACKVWSSKPETVPTIAVRKFLNSLSELKIIKNRCNDKKVKAIRIILEKIGWIKIIDENYNFVKHISMKYILLEKHPYFNQYQTIIGKENYENLKTEKPEIEIVKKTG